MQLLLVCEVLLINSTELVSKIPVKLMCIFQLQIELNQSHPGNASTICFSMNIIHCTMKPHYVNYVINVCM